MSVIEWPNVCGSSSPLLWDSDRVLKTSTPVLSQCFQDTVLVWIPCGVFLLTLSIYLPYLRTWPSVNKLKDKGKWQFVKLGTLVMLILLALIELLHGLLGPLNRPPSLYIRCAVLIITYILAIVTTHLEFKKGFHTSCPLFILWTFMFVCDIVPFYIYILDPAITGVSEEQKLSMVVFYIHFVLIVVQVIGSLWSDKQAIHDQRPSLGGEKEPLLKEEAEGNKKQPCPETRASFLNLITHSWITSQIIAGYKRPVVFDDLYDMMERDKSLPIVDVVSSEWKGQTDGINFQRGQATKKELSKPSIMWPLIKASQSLLLTSVVNKILWTLSEFSNPLLLNVIIAWITSDDPYIWKGYLLSVVVFIANILISLFVHMYFRDTYIIGMRCRTAIITAVYRKALRLSHSARRNATVGEIVNLMSVDAQKVHDACQLIHEWWMSPLGIILCMYMLWLQVGPASMAGLVLLLLLTPINGGYVSVRFAKLQGIQMKHKDERIKVLSEVLGGIKIIKMYAWENSFIKKVFNIREEELKCVRSMAWLNAAVGIMWFATPYLVSLVVFATYVLASPDNNLDPATAFVTINVIGILNWTLNLLPTTISLGSQAYISLQRIKKFLLLEEIDTDAVNMKHKGPESVVMKDAILSWDQDCSKITLKDINLNVGEGQLVAVVGTVGSGKSSLLSALLGEMHKKAGYIGTKGSIAYVPQQAWIQNMTLKENILFGKEDSDGRYEKVVSSCALEPDFEILPGGDSTEIGEKGINLSGGQKQRVSLARAVYQNNDLYLLDDPLSAVDAHVGKQLFEDVIGPNGLLRNKTRILVTHGITYLPKVDCIITMNNGQISEMGTYEELIQKDGAFAEFIRNHLNDNEDEEDDIADAKDAIRRQISLIDSETQSKHSRLRQRRLNSRRASTIDDDTEYFEDNSSPKAKLIEEETAEVGQIQLPVLTDYTKTAGIGYFIVFVVFWMIYLGTLSYTNIWLSLWSDDPIINGTEGRKQTFYRLGVYAGVGLSQIFSQFVFSMAVFIGGVVASENLHHRLLYRIMRAPMSFFDTTPLGRIVNRFSTDMDKIDSIIPLSTRFWANQVAAVASVLIIVSYSTPIFLTVVPPLGLIFYIVQKVYITTVRQLKRLDSIRRSPIYVNFDETLVGVTCVRAFKRQSDFIARNDQLTDDSQTAWYPVLIAQRWLGFWLESLGAVSIFAASIFAVLARDTLSGGLAGLSVSFAMQTSWTVSMMIRGATELETHVVSVERIKEYSEIESEAEWENEETKPKRTWPDEGQLKLDNYSTRYRTGLDLVLKSMTFTASPGEKVGIVGRTGAGKSSMALSLFRIIEAASGKIMIDGVDISKVGLHDLRSKLTIIPQDPLIFSGSLRQNLDPFDSSSENELWAALELAHLKKFVLNMSEGLDYECGEGGEALSVGQRQLVCLARALLRKTRILILDEATAAVDMETDDLIQTTIRTAFKDYTVLTVAHRLNTILDYDRVIVLSEGEIIECDKPSLLIEDKRSIFYSMAKDSGIVS